MADHGGHGGGGGHAPAAHGSGGGSHGGSSGGHSSGGGSHGGGGGGSFSMGTFGLIVFVLVFIFWMFKPIHKNDKQIIYVVEKEIEKIEPDRIVNYGPDFGATETLPPHYNYYFAGATEPYCYTNVVDSLACAGAGQDATGKFGNSPSNKALRFKSSNGKNGHLTIKFIKQ